MFDYSLALMTGVDIPIPECQVVMHQPTIKEISRIGEKNFFLGVQCLCITRELIASQVEEQDKRVLENTPNFQIFMTVVNDNSAKDKKEAVNQVLTLLFPKNKVLMTPFSISVMPKEGFGENVVIDDNNFESLQQVVKKTFRLGGSDQPDFNPQGKKAKEIAEKLMRARQRVAEQKAKEQGSGSMLTQYLSVITVGLHSYTMEKASELTIYQLYDLIERFSLYTNWDIDIRSRLAGAKIDTPPINWMKNIYE